MKHKILIILSFLSVSLFAQLPMGGWQMHSAYGYVSNVETGNSKVYALSYGSLMSVDKEDGTIEYYNKLTGLTSSNITKICFDRSTSRLLIAYSDGNLDLLDEATSEVYNISDLYHSRTGENKTVQDIVIDGKTAYLAMTFGILELDLSHRELKETFYIGKDASSVNVKRLALSSDTLYAVSDDMLYSAALGKNKIDYHYWQSAPLPVSGKTMAAQNLGNSLYLLLDSTIYRYEAPQWKVYADKEKYYALRTSSGSLLAINSSGMDIFTSDTIEQHINHFTGSQDVAYDSYAGTYWFAFRASGVGRLNVRNWTYNQYKPNGPAVNTPYRMHMIADRLFVVPGGYWTGKYYNPFAVMIYENGEWKNYNSEYVMQTLGRNVTDCVDIAADPNDVTHFFVAVLGAGVLEFRNDEFAAWYNNENSPFKGGKAVPDVVSTFVDALMYDEDGNLWMINEDRNGSVMCVLTPDKRWVQLKHSDIIAMYRAKHLLTAKENKNIKIFANYFHDRLGVGVLDDNGTLERTTDDKTAFFREFVDQNNKTVAYEAIYDMVQDNNNELWVATDKGLFIIPNVEDMFKSNACRRVIIERTDGSGLADYLLGEERINAIAVDGANRKWIGTQNSGLYLMSADGTETIEHFTTDNSPLPDNAVVSLAINKKNGEVFVGTGVGLVSYQSNAAEGEDEIPNDQLYAYPNPVRENFEGMITITGLIDGTKVKITDPAGLLVAEATSLGAFATWDGKDGNGNRVRSGVYTAQCVSPEGNQYALVKILIIK